MAESTTTRLIRAPRTKVYSTVADIQALAKCLQPEGTSSRTIGYDHVSGSLRMEISHGPGLEDTRRFHLAILEMRQDEVVVYGAAFDSDDPLLAGEIKIHFALKEAPGGTQITVRHEGIPARISVKDNERGTESSLKNLARLIEGTRRLGHRILESRGYQPDRMCCSSRLMPEDHLLDSSHALRIGCPG